MKTTYLILSLFLVMPFKSVAYKPSLPRHILHENIGHEIARKYQDRFAQLADNQPDDLVVPAAPNIFNVIDEARDIDDQFDRAMEYMSSPCAVLCPIMAGFSIILFIKELIG